MGYNLEKINALSDGDKDFVESVVVTFVEEVSADLIVFTQQVVLRNYEGIYQASHKLKPNLDFLGMKASYDLNLKIVNWSKERENMDEIVTSYKDLESRLNENIVQLKKDFNLN